MITFLSGGTGTPKLLRGMQELLDEQEIAVVVNTAEDMWLSGNHLSPDIDTVMYLFADILDTGRWWGIRDDTYITHDLLARLGVEEFIAVGDQDRAVHVARGEMLRSGMRLTEATAALCTKLDVLATVLPMTVSVVTTYVKTRRGEMHFPEYWVKHRGDVAIEGVVRRYRQPPVATGEVIGAIEASDAVVIGPANPASSILPILDCEGMRRLLLDTFVVAVSPFRGDVLPDPKDAALMYAAGEKPTSPGVFRLYGDIVDVFVQDLHDPDVVEGSLRLETRLLHERQAESLAWDIMAVIRHAVS